MRRLLSAVALLLALTGCQSGGGGTVDGSDAELACAVVRKLPEKMPEAASEGADAHAYDIAMAHLGSAAELARAAARADGKHQPLADALHHAQLQISASFDVHRAEPDIKQARTYC